MENSSQYERFVLKRKRPTERPRRTKGFIAIMMLLGGLQLSAFALATLAEPKKQERTSSLVLSASRLFQNCFDAQLAREVPIPRGEPGYHSTLDGDGDGMACEPVIDGVN